LSGGDLPAGTEIQVYAYPDLKGPFGDMAQLDSGSQSSTGTVEWTAPPSFHLSGMVIVVYVGTEPSVIGLLSDLVGKPIVGGVPTGATTTTTITSTTTTASWDDAQSLIRSGTVQEIYQSHAREVKLRLKDGTWVTTTEPEIDDVFRVVKECGAPCSTIVIATE
jgi:hypothetical protein